MGEGIITLDTRVPHLPLNLSPVSGSPTEGCLVYTPASAVTNRYLPTPLAFTRALYLTRNVPFRYNVSPGEKDCRVSDLATATCIHRSDRVGLSRMSYGSACSKVSHFGRAYF